MKKQLTLVMLCCFTISFSQEAKPLFIKQKAALTRPFNFSTSNPLIVFPATINTTRQSDAVKNKVNILLPKIDFSEKKTYYFKNNFTDNYNSYIFYGGQLLPDKNYGSQYEIAPNCHAYYRPYRSANSVDIAGALLSALVDNLDLKFKLFHNTAVTFE